MVEQKSHASSASIRLHIDPRHCFKVRLQHLENGGAHQILSVGIVRRDWHLRDAGHVPETRGFDVNIGGTRDNVGAPSTFFYPDEKSGRGPPKRADYA